jgi:hypothetical protein
MNDFDKNLGKEIFMLSEEKRTASSVIFFENTEEILSCFNNSVAINTYDINLYHGILTRAISIPLEMNNNIDILIIIKNINSNKCNIFPCIDIAYAQKFISVLVGSENVVKDYNYFIIDEEISKLSKQNIDNIYIFYGYTIELHYSFNKNELDDEIITGSKEIYANISSKQ